MKALAVLAIALLLPFSALAAQPDKAKLVDAYMEAANVKASHVILAKSVLDEINRTHRQMGVDVTKLPRESQQEIRRIQSVVKTIFSPEVFNKGVANHLVEHLTEEQLEKVNKLHKDSMIRRITKIERQMIGKVDYNKLKAYHITLSVNPPSKQRMGYIEYMDQVSEASKYGSYLRQYIYTLFTGAALDPETVARIDKTTKDEFALTSLYVYRVLSDDDLKGYLEMMTTQDDVAYVIRQTTRAQIAVAARAFDRLSKELVTSGRRIEKSPM